MSIETNVAPLHAPFPYFGGKRRIATRVWEALGDVRHYVEPFCGSAAVLLARPHAPQTETINDADAMVCNFWRAVKAAPDEVAHYADWPVIETDLHARHRWLIGQRESMTAALEADPEFFDAKVAGWWVWGACAWIGTGWCGAKAARQMPRIGDDGSGLFAPKTSAKFGGARAWVESLSMRMRSVRVTVGSWERILGHGAVMGIVREGSQRVGVYIDPPYSEGNQQYAAGGTGTSLSAQVRAWCESHDEDPQLRIVLSGYAGEHDSLEARGWSVAAWGSAGGYANQGKSNANQKRERLWLSPHCLRADHGPLFGGAA